jgi:hypothetical protein
MRIKRPAKAKSKAKISSLFLILATTSVWIGCTVNNNAANKATSILSGNTRLTRKKIRRQVARYNARLMVWLTIADSPNRLFAMAKLANVVALYP